MTTHIDTIIGNRRPSKKLEQMLLDFRSNTGAWLGRIEEIREQARKQNFKENEIDLLLRNYLSGFTTKRQIRYLLDEKPRIKEQKKRREEQGVNYTDANMHKAEPETVNIPTDYKVVVPDQVLEEEIKQLTGAKTTRGY